MRTPALALAFAAFMMPGASAGAETIRVAAWNLNNLHFVVGEPLRGRAPARSEEDYATLRAYRDRVRCGHQARCSEPRLASRSGRPTGAMGHRDPAGEGRPVAPAPQRPPQVRLPRRHHVLLCPPDAPREHPQA
jgi:hypothetical protein